MIRAAAARRAGRAGRPGHRQDRGGAAPRRVPALHPPGAARRPAACCSSGPNRRFLRYIDQVLPSLGETGVCCHPRRALSRGRRGRPTRTRRSPRSRATCGWPACSPARCGTGSGCCRRRSRLDVDGTSIVLRPRGRARGARAGPARPASRTTWPGSTFVRELLGRARRPARGVDRAARCRRTTAPTLLAELRESRDVRRELNAAGCRCSPQRLLADLYADPARLAAAAPGAVRARSGRCCAGTAGAVDAGRRAAARRGGRAARRGRQPPARPAAPAEAAPRRPSWSTPGRSLRRLGGDGRRWSTAEDARPPGWSADAGPADRRRAGRGRPRPGPSGTSSSTRRRSCRRWPGGC